MFNPAFDSCEAPDAARLERLAAALPAALAALLRDELGAGNRVRTIASGHPAPPVGVGVILERRALTLRAAPAAAALQARGLVRCCWPGRVQPSGWTDATGHCFLLEPPGPPGADAPVAEPRGRGRRDGRRSALPGPPGGRPFAGTARVGRQPRDRRRALA